MADHPTAPERRVRAHYTYDELAFFHHRSKSWVMNGVSTGKIEGRAGLVPLHEILRLTGWTLDEFVALHGETMPSNGAGAAS